MKEHIHYENTAMGGYLENEPEASINMYRNIGNEFERYYPPIEVTTPSGRHYMIDKRKRRNPVNIHEGQIKDLRAARTFIIFP